MKSVDSFAYVKGTEVRNLLFYGLLSNLDSALSIEQLAHLGLFICMIRLLHHGHILEERTSDYADRLFTEFYKDHELYYDNLQNFKLHLHAHYSYMYEMHGAFSNVNCFGPEDLIGSVSANSHGTRYYGDSITHYYNIEFHLKNKKQESETIDGPSDPSPTAASDYDSIKSGHIVLCDCDQINSCCNVYRRFVINGGVFHSLIYEKRKRSISYFVQYLFDHESKDYGFGAIELFFTCNARSYAVIRCHRVKHLYSDNFKDSSYYFLLKKPLDSFYFILEKNHHQTVVVETNLIISHCVIAEKSDHLFVTTFSSYHEHD